MDQSFNDLLEASSLGTPSARFIRSLTASEVVDDVRRRMEGHREPSLREAAAIDRQLPIMRRHLRRAVRAHRIAARTAAGSTGSPARKPDQLRARRAVERRAAVRARAQRRDEGAWIVAELINDQATYHTRIEADIDRGSFRHRRLPAALRLIPLFAFGGGALLLVYFFSGMTNVNWASPFSAALASIGLLAAMVAGISFASISIRFTSRRRQRHKNDTSTIWLNNRSLGSRRLTDAIALAVVAVMAIAGAAAATAFGLRSLAASKPGVRIVIAAPATANEPSPTLSAAVSQILRAAGDSSAGAAIYLVASDARQPTVLPLTPRSANGQVDYGPDRARTLTANISAVERALQNEATTGPLDLLGLIDAATRDVSPPATLIVVSSGLSTAGGFDLRQVGWDAEPSFLTASLKAKGLLPDLAGWHVVFSGLGDVAGRQPALPQPLQATLASYWTAICQASGAASCTVDTTARPQVGSHVTSPAPVVPVPEVTSARGPGSASVTTDLPDSLLFQIGTATLNSYADKILQPIVQQARSQHLLVSISGYTSPDGGSNAYNVALSAQRANAVSERLIALGLPAKQIAQVTGAGTAGNRVVVVLLPANAESLIIHGLIQDFLSGR